MAMEELALLVSRKRGSMGIRAAAGEIGIGAATLSRIERGHVPDLATLTKICEWLEENPSRFIGGSYKAEVVGGVLVQTAFKKKTAVSPETARALANLILLASKQFVSEIEAEGH